MLNEIVFCNSDGKIKSEIQYGDTLYLYFKDKEFASVVNQGSVEVSPRSVTWSNESNRLAYYVENDSLFYEHDLIQSEGVHSRVDVFDATTGVWDVVSDITSYDDGSKYNAVTQEWEDDVIMSKSKKPVIQYKDWDAEVFFAPYMDNGNTALQLLDPDTGESITTATVNLGNMLPENVVLIKDWSENTGTVDALHQAGVIKPELLLEIPTGFVSAHAYELTDEYEVERQRQYEDNDLVRLANESRERATEQNPFANSIYESMFGDDGIDAPELDFSGLDDGDDDGINPPELDLSDLDDDGPEL